MRTMILTFSLLIGCSVEAASLPSVDAGGAGAGGAGGASTEDAGTHVVCPNPDPKIDMFQCHDR